MTTRPGTLQATFNSGEVAPELYQRTDVKQFYASAARMRNVEPVPQGGFRLMDRSRDLGAERTDLVLLAEMPAPAAPGSQPGGAVLATLAFEGPSDLSAVRLQFTAGAAAAARLVVEYRDVADGAWRPLAAAFALATTQRVRAAARPPGQPVRADAVRIVLTAGDAADVTIGLFKAYREGGAPSDVQFVPFTYSIADNYLLVLGASGLADVYRNGVFVGAVWHDIGGSRVREMVALQRLDTVLLFHKDVPQVRILRQAGGDHEWSPEPPPWIETPNVDLGGTYVRVAESWQIALRWPTATGGTAAGLIFIVTVDAQDTTSIGIPDPPDWNVVAADLQVKLRELATVGDGVVVTVGSGGQGLQILGVVFGGEDAGSQFVVSAKFINTADAGANALRITAGDPGGEALFSAERGYPTCGIFYQDRLIQGGFRAKPGAVLASPVGDYFSGNIEVETASGGILVNLDTDGSESIQRIARSKHLVIFTSDAEYFIADRAVRRDQAVNIVESSRNGSCPTVPIVTTETALLYVSKARSLVYTATYDDVAQAYVSEPLSLLARHLIKGINGAALQRADDRSDAARYFLVRDGGTMPVGLLIRSQDVTAFVEWVTDGQVKAVAVDGTNTVYLSVERITGGQPRRRLERLEAGLLVDGAVTRTNDPPSATVTGLALHEGATVWAEADGYVLGPFTVTDGAITLPDAFGTVTVGRWTPPVVTTLPIPRQVSDRVVHQRMARVYAVQVSVLGTTSLAIGANGEPAEDIPLYRAGMPVDLPQQPVSDWIELDGLEGWSIEGQVTITQAKPGALQVAALVVQARI